MMTRTPFRRAQLALAAGALCALPVAPALASSHREAPFITTAPKVDGTDFYMFRSYEPGREDFVTLIANYQPLQAPFAGPNYFKLDPNALYEIHIDNDGDAREDLTFQFRFANTLANGGIGFALPIGDENVPIPLTQVAPITALGSTASNVLESYTLALLRGDRRTGTRSAITNANGGSATFLKPVDNIGTKTIPNYAAYAAQHIYSVNIPGCAQQGRLFVGQRKDPFAMNRGTIYDLVNAPLSGITNPALTGAVANPTDRNNVTALAVEVHRNCLTTEDPVIGGWTTASLRQVRLLDPTPRSGHQTTDFNAGAWVQVSRLGMPLTNEVVIGLKDKDRFNGSEPGTDSQFARYVTNPTFPRLLEIALGIPGTAPTNFPRLDLVTTFLTGIPGLNRPAGTVVPAEMLRLNTDIPPAPFTLQNRLGFLGNFLSGGSDYAGFPNGRRPKDDVVDISLVALMGGLCLANGTGNLLGMGSDCNPASVPLGTTAFTLHDLVDQAVAPLLTGFPYLFPPIPGAVSSMTTPTTP
jgi:hypothetical protein